MHSQELTLLNPPHQHVTDTSTDLDIIIWNRMSPEEKIKMYLEHTNSNYSEKIRNFYNYTTDVLTTEKMQQQSSQLAYRNNTSHYSNIAQSSLSPKSPQAGRYFRVWGQDNADSIWGENIPSNFNDLIQNSFWSEIKKCWDNPPPKKVTDNKKAESAVKIERDQELQDVYRSYSNIHQTAISTNKLEAGNRMYAKRRSVRSCSSCNDSLQLFSTSGYGVEMPNPSRFPMNNTHSISTTFFQSVSDAQLYFFEEAQTIGSISHSRGRKTCCSFCYGTRKSICSKNNLPIPSKDDDGPWSTHPVAVNNRIVCPVLSRNVCPYCGATGEVAHTAKNCPMYSFSVQNRSPTDGFNNINHFQFKLTPNNM